jgi:hypothetical protein
MKFVTAFAVLLLLLGRTGIAQHGPGIASDTESHLAEVVITSDDGRVLVMLDTVLDARDGPDGFIGCRKATASVAAANDRQGTGDAD